VLQTGNFTTGSTQTLVGWQARVVGQAEGDTPKYLSCAGMQKSRLLYGYGSAVRSRGPVVVCEGPTDVWRLGRHGVALFGKSLSLFQRELLAHNFPGRPVVVLLDSDAREEAEAVRREISFGLPMKDSDRKVVIAELPEGGKDPADFPREVVLDCVAKALDSTPQHLGLV
jgi:DNA primase